MDIVHLLLLALAGGLIAVIRHARLYPANWENREYIYAARHRDARDRLQRARRRMRSVEDGEQKRVEALKQSHAESISKSDNLVRSLTAKRDRISRPQLGARLTQDLGELRLYEHYLQFLDVSSDAAPAPDGEPLRLALISVEADLHAPENCYINVTTPEGKMRSAVYPRVPRFRERDVQAFYLRIRKQKSYDEEFARSQSDEEAELTARIGRVKAEKEQTRQACLREIEELVASQKTAPERLSAEEEWEKARQEWENETHRLPRLWARPWR